MVYFFAVLAVLAGCTTAGERTRMRAALDSINQLNRSDQPFTAKDVEPYVRFFDRHSSPNDQVLAHYLLGRAYYEHGEAPMALQCYHDALDCADTTAQDCDYAQLSRVYGQMAQVFYQQGLYQEQLQKTKLSVNYAWRGRDTLLALMNYEQESFAYDELGLTDSAIFVIEDVASKYEQYGHPSDAAISLGTIIRTLVNKGEYKKAKRYMEIYESNSGFFDCKGNIEKGREIYYMSRGVYYIKMNLLDSAEYYYRKVLINGSDNNCQHAGAKGLADLYYRLNRTDSAAKYALYAYAMQDSVYAQKDIKEVERMQGMYDYTRNQEIAKKKTEEARINRERLQYVLLFFFMLSIVSINLMYRFIRNRRERLNIYLSSLEELKQLRAEKAALSQHQEENRMIILEKNKKIDYLEQRVKKYGKQAYFKTANAERCLKESPTYKDVEKKAIHGQYLTEEDWKRISILIKEYLPSFDDFLATNLHRLKLNELHILILLRLHFKAVDVAGMIGISKSQISQNSTEIMKKIYNAKGSSKELSARIGEIF